MQVIPYFLSLDTGARVHSYNSLLVISKITGMPPSVINMLPHSKRLHVRTKQLALLHRLCAYIAHISNTNRLPPRRHPRPFLSNSPRERERPKHAFWHHFRSSPRELLCERLILAYSDSALGHCWYYWTCRRRPLPGSHGSSDVLLLGGGIVG